MLHPTARISGAPRVPKEHLTRPRLLQQLDVETALTVLRAPAGSGKSALLAEWAGAESTDGAWVTLTADDRTRTSFWSTVATAIQEAGLVAPDSVLAGVPHLGAHATDLQRVLVRGMHQLGGRTVLVLDDFEHATDPRIAEDVCAVLRQCAHLSVMVATRIRSALDDATVALTLDRTTIDGHEFLFTRAETAELLARWGGADGAGDLPPEAVERVHAHTGGHPLMVRALLMEARTEGRPLTDESHLDRLSGNIVRESVRRTLAADADGELSLFLLRTSVAEVVTEPLARLLSGAEDVSAHLHRAEALGIGAWLPGHRGAGLRYHPVIRELLREEAERRIPGELPALHAHIARRELVEGSPLAALRHALAAEDDDLASRVVMVCASQLLEHREELRELLLGVPLSRMRHQPFLAGALGLTLNADPWQRVRAVQYLGLAVWGVRHRRPRAGAEEKLVLDVLESLALRLTGSSRGLGRARQAAQALSAADDRLAGLSSQLVLLRNQTAISLFRLGRADEALQALEGGLTPPAGSSEHALHHTLAIRAGVLAHVGAMTAARAMRDRADALDWPEGARDDYTGALYHYAAAWERLEDLDPAGAQLRLDALAPHLDTLEYQPYFVVLQAFVGALEAANDPGLVRIREHAQIERTRRRAMQAEREMVEIAGAMLHHFAGRLGAARKALGKVTATAGSHAIHGVVDLAAGRPEEALARLATSHRTGEVAPRVSAVVELVLAASALRLGDEDTALDAACRLVATMAHHGLRVHLVLVPRDDLLAVRDLLSARRPDLLPGLGDVGAVPDLVRPYSAVAALSEREEVVLRELVTTPSTTEIAAALGVSTNTVKSQLRSIYRKLGVRSREDALAVALREGFVGEDG